MKNSVKPLYQHVTQSTDTASLGKWFWDTSLTLAWPPHTHLSVNTQDLVSELRAGGLGCTGGLCGPVSAAVTLLG